MSDENYESVIMIVSIVSMILNLITIILLCE